MNNLKTALFTALSIMAVAAPGSALADTANGEQLHSSTCVSCHISMFGGDGSSIYTRNDRRVTDLPGLKRQVTFCELNLGLTWFDDQIQDVTDYLNTSYYKFSQ
jgi:cytochrome c2